MHAATEEIVRDVLEELRDLLHTLHLFVQDLRELAERELKDGKG